MAAVASAAGQATDLLQKLSLEPKSKTRDAAAEATKKNTSVPSERSVTPILPNMDSMCYFPTPGYQSPYFFAGYEGMNEWDDYSRFIHHHEGVEMPPGVYQDLYHSAYGYAPYSPYPSPGSPAPAMVHDGQLYGPQYQYPAAPYYPPPINAPYTPNQAPTSKGEVAATSAASDQPPISLSATKVNSNGVANGNSEPGLPKANQQHSSVASNGSYSRGGSLNELPSSAYQDPRYNFDGARSSMPWIDAPVFPDPQLRYNLNNGVSTGTHGTNCTSVRSQNIRPVSQLMGLQTPRPTPGMGSVTPGAYNRMYSSNRMYNAYSTGLGIRSNFYNAGANGRWGFVDKYKSRGGRVNGLYGYSNESLDGLNELNRGPRANRSKGFAPVVTISTKGQNPAVINGNVEDSSVVPDKDQYNKESFAVDYPDAKFFIIKSYSEDDVHKSVKYNVWASTPNGNKKLDAAYREAQEKAGGCPVFLFFSVNTSGQFVGVAEMVGPVDFDKTVDYWQQDKWNGCFPVKWHIVKDVPNISLKHIILDNNDNKPVTNSRDTQEVKLEQGLQVLKLFKEYASKTNILDDFSFYESRQKIMQERRATQQQLHKQGPDAKPVDNTDENARLKKALETVTALKKESTSGLVERKQSEENASAPVAAADALNVKSATEKRAVANGVAAVVNCVANGS